MTALKETGLERGVSPGHPHSRLNLSCAYQDAQFQSKVNSGGYDVKSKFAKVNAGGARRGWVPGMIPSKAWGCSIC
jgi:hypothetical protein